VEIHDPKAVVIKSVTKDVDGYRSAGVWPYFVGLLIGWLISSWLR